MPYILKTKRKEQNIKNKKRNKKDSKNQRLKMNDEDCVSFYGRVHFVLDENLLLIFLYYKIRKKKSKERNSIDSALILC